MVEARPLRAGDPASIGSYTLKGVLGEGGQGTVFLGERDGTQVAVKLLHARFAEDDEARGRFVRELEVAKQVARFCTAQVLDADVEGDRPYIVSEFVPGVSLHEQVKTEGPRTEGALERLAVSTLTALTAIHQAGIIHRDFKPHNVLIGPDGPRVIDFGIARALNVTSHSHSIGTPAYMSPEQLNGHQLTAASDMFSWASCMLFAATGTPPFGNDEIGSVLYRIAHAEADTSALPTPLREVVQACLAKDPASRPTAAQAQAMLMGGEPPVLPAQEPAAPPVEAASPQSETVPPPTEVLPPVAETPPPPAAGAHSLPAPPVPQPVSAWSGPPQQPEERPPYPFEIGPPPGESDAMAGRRAAIAVVIFIIVLLSIGITGWALTRDGDKDKGDEATGLIVPRNALTESSRPARDAAGGVPARPGKGDGYGAPADEDEPRPTVTVTVTTPAKPERPKPSGTPRTPESSPSTPPAEGEDVQGNPYTAVQVCNSKGRSGFSVQRSLSFRGGRTFRLTNGAGVNCVVTLKTEDVGRETRVFARIIRKADRRSDADRGMYKYYAGPVYLPSKGGCVKFSGGGPSGSAASPWNC